MKIRRISITDFRGIQELDVEVPPEGAVIAGDNGEGKTSIIRAIDACLRAQGIEPSNIRVGADAANILIDLDALRVRRTISHKGTSVSAMTSLGERVTQERLQELLGGAESIDPLSFFLANGEDRRAMVLERMPVRVTADDLARWTGLQRASFTNDADDGNGFEVLARVAKRFYTLRTEVNRMVKERTVVAKAVREAAQKVAADRDVGGDVEEARAALDAAKTRQAHLQGRAETAARAREATAEIKEQAKLERQVAKDLRERMPAEVSPEEAELATGTVARMKAEVDRLTAELERAKGRLSTAEAVLREHAAIAQRRKDMATAAEMHESNAATIERGISMVDGPTALEETTAMSDLEIARVKLEEAVRGAHARKAEEDAVNAEAALEASREESQRLDEIVTALTKTAVAELAGRADLVPGFDPNAMTLDGKPIDLLSSSEQMRFSIELAKRMRGDAEARIMIIDGLERVSGKRRTEFLRMATADGWQVIATRVENGKIVLEAISS